MRARPQIVAPRSATHVRRRACVLLSRVPSSWKLLLLKSTVEEKLRAAAVVECSAAAETATAVRLVVVVVVVSAAGNDVCVVEVCVCGIVVFRVLLVCCRTVGF